MRKYTDKRPTCVCDTECFPNFWSIAFREVEGPRVRSFERTLDRELDVEGVRMILRNWRVVTFNGVNYDNPMIGLALLGASNEMLKKANDDIILGGLRYWEFEERYGSGMPFGVDLIDAMEVSPGSPTKPSLKLYAGRLHSKRMQDLPFDPGQWLSDDQIKVVRSYHGNDLQVTVDYYNELKPSIELRAQMSEQYGVDLRSKSDPQVAEAVVRAEIQRREFRKVYKPDIVKGVFRYKAPDFIHFKNRELQALLQAIQEAPFVIGSDGIVRAPEVLEKSSAVIGDSTYKLGIGGLHSTEKSVANLSDDEIVLLDRDVTSYYANIILILKLWPKHLGPVFLAIYRELYERRIAAKRAGDKNTAESLKITILGLFGKTGSPYSILYAPELMIQITVTGQLCALMLIEAVENARMTVISANTDGFVTRVPRDRRDEFEQIMLDWELATGFNTEESEYDALYSRDVNNYIAIGADGKVKTKGTFAKAGPGLPGASGMKKNPDGEIVNDAVIAYLQHGTPVEQTIRSCTDIRRFVTVRRVKGGAVQDGKVLGKAIRYYKAVDGGDAITYRLNGNNVPSSEGAMPCMELPEHFPLNVDYDAYVREAYATLRDLGVEASDPALRGRRGWMYGRLPGQSTWHIADLPSGEARCGRQAVSLREPWKEAPAVPVGEKLCKACGLTLKGH